MEEATDKSSPIISELKPQNVRFLDVLGQIIANQGFKNERQFLVKNGLNQALIHKIRKGLQGAPTKLIAYFGTEYGVNVNYILTGLGEPFAVEKAIIESNVETLSGSARYIEVPFVSEKATASFIENFSSNAPFISEEPYRLYVKENEDLPKGACVVGIQGDSMEPQLVSGARILIVPISISDWIYQNSGVYAVAYSSYLVVKRIKDNDLMRQRFLILHSDNPKGGSLTVPAADIRGLWKVIKVVDSPVR
jgi:phage repressor protein C with HTH and peptisase S24 domain